jgi:ABC-2 type transport system ATP-binding protein
LSVVDAVTDRPATPADSSPDQAGREIVISAQHVGKRFMSGGIRATSLKERLVSRRHRNAKDGGGAEAFWALRDVTTEIPRGQTVGLIGANGSGKSTLLKVLAGILRTTEGEVAVKGRIASLLELGAGFNGELSGRDNVYLNASLLGLTHAETDKLFDSIVDFAELRHKIDDEVKHYSSGQYVRLGFAVAVHVDPDILLVDEVLAVGDEAFQRKCLARIQDFRRQGRTILFVSHALELVESVCDRVLVLRSGELVFDGEPATGTELLREQLRGGPLDAPTRQSPVQPTGVSFHADDGSRMHFMPDETLIVKVDLDVDGEQAQQVDLQVAVVGAQEIPVWVMRSPGTLTLTPGACSIDFVVPALPELQGAFAVRVEISDPTTGSPLATCRFPDIFSVNGHQPAGLLAVPYDVRTDV